MGLAILAAFGILLLLAPQVQAGCTSAGDKCPYGYGVKRSGGHGWWCEPCGNYGPPPRYYRDYDGPPAYQPPPRYYPYYPPPRYPGY
jgi:hypothetical protein